MTKLAASNEIIGASFVANCSMDDKRALQSDPQAFLLAKTNVDIGDDVKIGFVDNDARTVHLALPYYSNLDNTASQSLGDGDLSDAAGGEIFIITLGLIIGGGAIAGTVTGAVAADKAGRGQNIDGSSK